MKTARSPVVAIGSLASMFALAGCQAPGRVLEPLPPPFVQTYRATPAEPLPPKPPVSSGRPITGAVIVVDPGHGGKDPGAWPRNASRLPEKTIVLDVATKVAQRLATRGAKVVYTRASDVFIELDDRAAAADRYRADLFVAIHADSAQRESASGTGVHVYTQASPQSQRAALSIVAAFQSAGIETRGVFHSNFRVLRGHSRPAVLIECGFLTNPGDARNLNDASYRSQLAAAIAEGIADYFGR